MRAFSNEGVMDLAIEVMLLRRKQARGQNQAVQVIKLLGTIFFFIPCDCRLGKFPSHLIVIHSCLTCM